MKPAASLAPDLNFSREWFILRGINRTTGEVPMPHVYILECGDGTYYTGSAKDLNQRLKKHASGRGARYTAGRLPVRLVYSEAFESIGAAQSREWAIKKLTRAGKESLIRGEG
jgi:putative endonuclease